ncbi:MAG TPA: TIGR04283 family arsenosugar biosynthesis glycosyltransferase [Candidatus Methylomirabilis sp.]|jgi:rSAM/selenodomain-associated transferase 2
MSPQLSIIIPARDDAEALARTLDHIVRLPGIETAELIVAAWGDPAGTGRAAAWRARVLWPPDGTRAALMNAGAAVARGETLLFLHADSLPPPDALARIEDALADARVVGGAFAHRFLEPGWSLRAISGINRIRYRLTGNYYGDQGLFVRAEVFRRMGGYRALAILEDLDFSQRLKRIGKTALVPVPLYTSGRRFVARGPWRTFWFMVWLLALHTLGLDAQRYAERYHGPEGQPPGSPWPRGPAPEPARGPGMSTAHGGAA